MVNQQYEVYLISLDPTIGHEVKKARPCVIISPDEMNRPLETVIIAPMTTVQRDYPTRIPIVFAGKDGWVMLDQIRTIDKKRIIKLLGVLSEKEIKGVKKVIYEMLVL